MRYDLVSLKVDYYLDFKIKFGNIKFLVRSVFVTFALNRIFRKYFSLKQ